MTTQTQTSPQTSSTESPIQQLLTAVLKEAELTPAELDDLPLDTRVTAAGLAWESGKPKPNDADMAILFIFSGSHGDDGDDHLPGDARVYAVPTKDGMPFVRYTVNRQQTVGYRFTSMNGAVFVRQLAHELERLAVAEGIRFDCPECATTLKLDVEECTECGWSPDDDGEEENDETAAAAAAPNDNTATSATS
jgi:hypothetical protein